MRPEEFDKLYCEKLNTQQLEAVHSVDGPVLLLAVPGSGKTTVLVTRLGSHYTLVWCFDFSWYPMWRWRVCFVWKCSWRRKRRKSECFVYSSDRIDAVSDRACVDYVCIVPRTDFYIFWC